MGYRTCRHPRSYKQGNFTNLKFFRKSQLYRLYFLVYLVSKDVYDTTVAAKRKRNSLIKETFYKIFIAITRFFLLPNATHSTINGLLHYIKRILQQSGDGHKRKWGDSNKILKGAFSSNDPNKIVSVSNCHILQCIPLPIFFHLSNLCISKKIS